MMPRHLTHEQLTMALAALSLERDNEWALCCELLIRSGMRGHELTHVTLADVDVTRAMLAIHAAKGSKDRVVPVDKGCLFALERGLRLGIMPWQIYQADSFKALLRRHWAKIRIKVLGLGLSHCSLHGLRASFAVRLYQDVGRDVVLVQELLGHKKIENTMRYVRLVQADEKKADILKAFRARSLPRKKTA